MNLPSGDHTGDQSMAGILRHGTRVPPAAATV